MTGSFYLDKGDFFRREILAYTNLFSVTDPVPSHEPVGELGDPEQIALSKVEKIFFHTTSSLSESILYLPSNHHPLGGIDYYLYVNLTKGKISFENGTIFSDSYLTAYVKTLPYWWMNWDGSIVPRTLVPMGFVLLLIIQGFILVWERNRLAAVMPLLVLFFHICTYALFSRSGGRFIGVVDWITLVYFSLGLTWLSFRLGRAFGLKGGECIFLGIRADTDASPTAVNSSIKNNLGIYTGAVFALLLGVSMPILESLIPAKYTTENLATRLETVNPQIMEKDSFQIMADGGPGWLFGKGIYPGYYRAGELMLDDRVGRVPNGDISRLDFYLVGMENIWVSIPLEGAPEYFPHGSEVIILGEITRDSEVYLEEGLRPYLLAEQVLVLKDGTTDYYLITASSLAEDVLE